MTAIRSLHHVTLNVDDGDAARAFTDRFGLDAVESGRELRLRCPGREQDQVVLREGGGPALASVTFTVGPGELDGLRRRLAVAEVAETDGDGDGLWCADPHGNRVQVIEGHPAPPRPLEPWAANIAGRYERTDVARWTTITGPTAPRRLGHALIFTPDLAATEAFYCDVLGLRLSDRIAGLVTFLNTGAGDHHVFGAIASDAPGIHHCSFEVDDIDALGMGIDQLQDAGFPGWGLGRHTIGSNFFHYTRTPFGPLFEYFCDIDQISEDWKPSDHHVKPWVWGSPPPADFLANTRPS